MSAGSAGSLPEDIASLQDRLDSAFRAAEHRRTVERQARASEMRELESARADFERAAGAWVRTYVVPRLRVLTRAAQQAGDVVLARDGCSASVKFRQTEEYPVSACLTVSVVPDTRYEHAELRSEPILIPMFLGHPRPTACRCSWSGGDLDLPVDSLDDAILAFVESYLKARDRDSPYQVDSLVIDPVCGMQIQRSDVAEVVEHDGKRYFFCDPSCAIRFREEPERYRSGSGRRFGGSP